jgi:hypothetical protein
MSTGRSDIFSTVARCDLSSSSVSSFVISARNSASFWNGRAINGLSLSFTASGRVAASILASVHVADAGLLLGITDHEFATLRAAGFATRDHTDAPVLTGRGVHRRIELANGLPLRAVASPGLHLGGGGATFFKS